MYEKHNFPLQVVVEKEAEVSVAARSRLENTSSYLYIPKYTTSLSSNTPNEPINSNIIFNFAFK